MTETRSSIKDLLTRMGQLETQIATCPQGNLPSTIEVNPKEHCKAITVRSGKKYEGPDEGHSVEEETRDQPAPVSTKRRLLKLLHQDQPLEEIPSYVKFMKEILSKKRKMEDYETVALTEGCSTILQKKLPPKLRDPGSFTIPCTIGRIEGINALCDLGASINLMPLSVFRRLKLAEAKPTTVTLQLADRSLAHPRGVIEDVLVKVDKFIFPADFIVLDMEEDSNVPIILGRPFLATGQALIDI
ncbi:uncharacterized protein LOC115695295 [Cannabis sativa]|uniref:uncharacterized protein LOC115695295 n=1 Tax=Cannabis sativa TaxID=3483 RepID=UPI0011E029A3|nr:uncharacterized protein LOC115695295 [Cannabis sativa]